MCCLAYWKGMEYDVREVMRQATQLAACQQEERHADALLVELKTEARRCWPESTKVEVPGEGSVRLGRTSATRVTTSYRCLSIEPTSVDH